MSDSWEQHGDHFSFDEMSAERDPDESAFVVTSFGPQPDFDRVFAAIRAAMPFGAIRLRVTPETKPTIEALVRDGRIKVGPRDWSERKEAAVMGIKRP